MYYIVKGSAERDCWAGASQWQHANLFFDQGNKTALKGGNYLELVVVVVLNWLRCRYIPQST